MRRALRISSAVFSVAFLLISLCACGGGGDSGSAQPASGGGGWVTVVSPAGTSPYETYCNSINLSGNAFISPTLWHCCSGSGTDTAVQVTWQNFSTGDSGSADQTVRVCTFLSSYLCDHVWYASIPLRLGSNNIRIRAAEVPPGTLWGVMDIVVNKPEVTWDVTGHVMTSDGRPLSWKQSGIELNLTAASSSTSAVLDTDGSYKFSCVRNGKYTISPTAPLGQTYTPPSALVTVNGSGVSGIDFVTAVYFVSGNVSWAVSGAPSANEFVGLYSGSMSISTTTDAQGNYRLAGPDGTYTVHVFDPLSPYPAGTITPDSQLVTISGADVGAIDFLRH